MHHEVREWLQRAEALLRRFMERDERQEFLDRAVIALATTNELEDCHELAGVLWQERERRRGQPSERELVVRWLNRQGRAAPGEKASTLFAAADAIKAGHHLEPEMDRPGGHGSTASVELLEELEAEAQRQRGKQERFGG